MEKASQLSLLGTTDNLVQEVASFPIENIQTGGTYTFTRGTANIVREYTHGLHVYPAKFIPQIPKWAFQYSKIKASNVILDPFCGCGTTLVEALTSGFNVYGIDINPLARLLTEVKTTPLYTNNQEDLHEDLRLLLEEINSSMPHAMQLLGEEKANLHDNWEFWFPEDKMAKLLTIKKSIHSFQLPHRNNLTERQITDVQNFYLACLSSVVKKSSMFDEKQIKVRKDNKKSRQDLIEPEYAFQHAVDKNIPGLIKLTNSIQVQGAPKAKVIGKYAQRIDLPDNSVDLIVTSPPYLNAIDYAMAHKYSLFVLDLITPDQFKDHCREYIGVTERAVRSQEYMNIQETGQNIADAFITSFRSSESAVDKIRAYIVSEYFTDMHKALIELYRVLQPNSLLIIIVGDNVLRKQYMPTSEIIQDIAVNQVGFSLENYFFHQLRNIRLKVPRNTTGGTIKKERVIILRKSAVEKYHE
jgi:DNA modification methylase